jgi:CRP/FNR family transcriptional regulator
MMAGASQTPGRKTARKTARKAGRKTGRCSVCGRNGPGAFCELEGREASGLEIVRTAVRFPSGQVIFHQGQPPHAVYCLSYGTVKVYKNAPKGGHIILRVLGVGELLGYRPVLANEPYAATAETITPATACVITRERLLESLRVSPELCIRLLAKMARELRISEEQLLSIASEPVRRRLARLLILVLAAARIPLRADVCIPVAYRRTDMAQMIGTTPETLSRTLRQMARQGLIRVTRAEIRVQDPLRLAAAAALEIGT